jgi:hypothetical protein
MLDPDHPEALVFTVDRATGTKTLAAAMYIAEPGAKRPDLPWHTHDNLCFSGAPDAWRMAGTTGPGEDCRPGTFRLSQATIPMVHVWIVPQPCGPFANLGEGHHHC